MNQAPLLIGGSPRSGTTAVLQVLNSSPNVFITSEENLIKGVRTLENLLDTRGRRAEKMKGGMRELSARETLTLDNIHRHNFDRAAVWATLHFIYEHHHAALHPNVPLVVWGDKLPAYARELESVLILPSVRYLHITRNPFDVINSMLRRLDSTRKGRDWWKSITDFDAMIEAWVEAFLAIEAVEERADVMHLHYEELVFDFERNIDTVNRFLGVTLSYKNVLINNPALHFERAHLTADMIHRIAGHPVVQRYIERYRNDESYSHVARAIRLQLDSEKMEMGAIQDSHEATSKPPLSDVDPNGQSVRVFVACTPAEWLPMRVLEYSIRETSTLPLELIALNTFNRVIPTPIAVSNRPRTPFSFQRFLIPELCGYSGKAIYLDADMQVFSDIAQLWHQSFEGYDLVTVQEGHRGRHGQFSVMLLDCSALKWRIEDIISALDSGELDYPSLMYEMRVTSKIGRNLPAAWNSLEQFDEGRTCLLHYTDMNTQPWISTANPLGHLWVACLRRALETGFISRTEVEREMYAGHVRPSLLLQLDTGIDCVLKLPDAARRLDRGFVAPYRNLHSCKARPWTAAHTALFAWLRRCYYRSPLPRLFS